MPLIADFRGAGEQDWIPTLTSLHPWCAAGPRGCVYWSVNPPQPSPGALLGHFNKALQALTVQADLVLLTAAESRLC